MNCIDNKMQNRGKIIIYQTPDGQTNLVVMMGQETDWLTANQLAALFYRDKSTICRHIKNVFKERELDYDAVVAKFATTAVENIINQNN